MSDDKRLFTVAIPDITITAWMNSGTGKYNYADAEDTRSLAKFVIDLAKVQNELIQEVIMLREQVNNRKSINKKDAK